MTRHVASTLAAGAVCYGVCAGLSAGRTMQAGPLALGPLSADLAVPGLAVLSLFLLAAALPPIIPNGPIRFPHTLTIPAVYASLLAVWATLVGTMHSPVVALPEPLAATATWGDAARWAPALAGQVAALTLWSLASRGLARR